ncbi:hypothetical protein QYF61_011294, partial [Mycteria americana]
MRICERNNSADTKVSEEGGGGGAPGAGAQSPLQPVVKTMVRQAVPLQPMEVHGGADIHMQPVEDPMLEQIAAIFLELRLSVYWIHGQCTPWGGPQSPDKVLSSQGTMQKARGPSAPDMPAPLYRQWEGASTALSPAFGPSLRRLLQQRCSSVTALQAAIYAENSREVTLLLTCNSGLQFHKAHRFFYTLLFLPFPSSKKCQENTPADDLIFADFTSMFSMSYIKARWVTVWPRMGREKLLVLCVDTHGPQCDPAQAPELTPQSDKQATRQDITRVILLKALITLQQDTLTELNYYTLEKETLQGIAGMLGRKDLQLFTYLIQTSFKYLQGWRLNHFPGQSVPMLDNPLGEEKFPNIQSKPPLVQLEAISSCPITCYLGEETDPHLSTTSFQAVVESDKVSPQPPFLQAKQSQLPQPLLIRLLLQTLHQLRCPSLDTIQHLNVSLVVGGPKLNTVFEVRPYQCRMAQFDPVTEEKKIFVSSLALPSSPLNHVPKHHIYMYFKNLRGLQLNHFPGQPVPVLDNPFTEEIFPNIQSKPPLAQLEAISSCPITCYLGKETDPHLSTTSFQVVVESDKVSPQPPFLQAKQPQFPQPLLIRLLLQTLHQLRCPSLDTLQHLNVSLVVRGPKLNTVFECIMDVDSMHSNNHRDKEQKTSPYAKKFFPKLISS